MARGPAASIASITFAMWGVHATRGRPLKGGVW
jgi:hypothetical protein